MSYDDEDTVKDLRKQIAALQRKNLELGASMASVYNAASIGVQKADRVRTLASAVVVQMHYLGGTAVCPPFALVDGLSDETITALLNDITYSHEMAIRLKPVPPQPKKGRK